MPRRAGGVDESWPSWSERHVAHQAAVHLAVRELEHQPHAVRQGLARRLSRGAGARLCSSHVAGGLAVAPRAPIAVHLPLVDALERLQLAGLEALELLCSHPEVL